MGAGGVVAKLSAWWANVSVTRSVIVVMAGVFAVHLTVSRVVDLPEAGGRYELLLGVAYFVFGILVAFAIENARSGLSRLNELLKTGDAELVSIYLDASAVDVMDDYFADLADVLRAGSACRPSGR